MNNIDKKYQVLLQDILDSGVRKGDRTGTGTISVFGRQIRHRMSEGFPLITTKKMHWKSIVTELLWFLRGDTNIKYLVENGCHIWDGDAYKNYVKKSTEDHVIETHKEVKDGFIHPELITHVVLSLSEFIERIKTDSEFAAKWGNLGSIYGKQWRNWNGKEEQVTSYLGGEINPYFCDCQERFEDGHSKIRKKNQGIDQIANLIKELKANPDSRRLMVSAWNPGEVDAAVLPPCHYGFQVYTRELSAKERLFFVNKSDDEYNKALSNEEQFKSIGLDFELALTSRMNELNIPTRAISLMYNARSQDVPLGTPFNIASYALLLEIIAKEVNMAPDELIANMGDCHIYLNQKEGVVEQLTREPYPLPTVKISDRVVNDISEYTIDDIILENYQSHPTIKMPLSN
jgi:thymidylate synthase